MVESFDDKIKQIVEANFDDLFINIGESHLSSADAG